METTQITTKIWVLITEFNAVQSGDAPSVWYATKPNYDNNVVEITIPKQRLDEWNQPPKAPKQMLFG